MTSKNKLNSESLEKMASKCRTKAKMQKVLVKSIRGEKDLILPHLFQYFFVGQTKVHLENQKKSTEKLLEQRE